MARKPSGSAKPSGSGSSSSGGGLNLAIACIPTLLSILYFQWNSVLSMVNVGHVDPSVAPSSNHSLVPSSNHTVLTAFGQLRETYAKACPKHSYRTRIFATDPLIIYVEDFISVEEREYIMNLAVPEYADSKVTSKTVELGVPSDGRKSQSAYLPYDPVSDCIQERSAAFQGNVDRIQVETLQVVKYGIGGTYKAHWDSAEEWDNPRITTFFAYLACDDGSESGPSGQCEGGATQFNRFFDYYSPTWCDVVACDDKSELGGVPFKAIPGNAIYWVNGYPNGTNHEGTMHAGMPVTSGRKIGLNIWTRKDPFEL